jgi:hypothetical protein
MESSIGVGSVMPPTTQNVCIVAGRAPTQPEVVVVRPLYVRVGSRSGANGHSGDLRHQNPIWARVAPRGEVDVTSHHWYAALPITCALLPWTRSRIADRRRGQTEGRERCGGCAIDGSNTSRGRSSLTNASGPWWLVLAGGQIGDYGDRVSLWG